MKLFTIGFTKTTAESFFTRLTHARVKKVIDVRLNNASQLAGFAKKEDLRYFLKAIACIDYEHRSELAPTQEMLDEYRKRRGAWAVYEERFLELMAKRKIEQTISPSDFEQVCLLCSEAKPDYCHRRLVVEYLKVKWGDFEVVHL